MFYFKHYFKDIFQNFRKMMMTIIIVIIIVVLVLRTRAHTCLARTLPRSHTSNSCTCLVKKSVSRLGKERRFIEYEVLPPYSELLLGYKFPLF